MGSGSGARIATFLMLATLGAAHAEPGTKYSYGPVPATILDSNNKQAGQERSPGSNQTDNAVGPKRWSRWVDDPIEVFNGLLVLFTLGLFGSTVLLWLSTRSAANAARDAAEANSRQLILAYPPKLLVTNVFVFPKGERGKTPTDLEPGQSLEGGAWVVNVGSDTAIIRQAKCVTYWRVGNLPMLRPYNWPDERTCECGTLIGRPSNTPAKRLKSGEMAAWEFVGRVPDDYTDAMSFYVMGFIEHRDTLNVRHLTLFARRYDAREGRFVACENNHDYEGHE
jgi:hypothetical protein